jgi:hypothetical protein
MATEPLHVETDPWESERNPFLPPESQFTPRESIPANRAQTVANVLAILKMVAIGIGTVAALIDIESIVATGPIISLLGLPVAIISIRNARYLGIVFGLSGLAITIACFLLIFNLQWSPHEAQMPVSAIGVCYAGPAILLGVMFVLRPMLTKK